MIKTRERRDLNPSIPRRPVWVPKSDPKGIVHVRTTFVLTRNPRHKFDITGFELTMTPSWRCDGLTNWSNWNAIVYIIYFLRNNRPFPSCLRPLYQNESKYSAFNMEMIFHSHAHANKTHFHKRGCALGVILKVRVFGTRW